MVAGRESGAGIVFVLNGRKGRPVARSREGKSPRPVAEAAGRDGRSKVARPSPRPSEDGLDTEHATKPASQTALAASGL